MIMSDASYERVDREETLAQREKLDHGLPKLTWPWYWHLTVTSGPDVHINIYLKKRWFGLFRSTIEDHGSDYLIMKPGEEFGWEQREKIRESAQEIFDGRFQRHTVMSALKLVYGKAKITKY